MNYTDLVNAFANIGLPGTVILITGLLALVGLRYMKSQGDKQNEVLKIMSQQHKDVLRASYWLLKQQSDSQAVQQENSAKALQSLNETLTRLEEIISRQDQTLDMRNRAAQVILNQDSKSYILIKEKDTP